jgi:hypothetical protein
MAEFAAEVRRLMAERGMLLRRLAKAASYDPSYLSKVLSGHKPSSPYLAAPRRRPRRGRRDPGRHPAATATPGEQSQRTAAEVIGRGRGAPGRDDR